MSKNVIQHGCFSILAAAVLSSPVLAAEKLKTLTLDSGALKSLRIFAEAGELDIEGTERGKQIEVVAEIVGDERDCRLSLEKKGAAAVLTSKTDASVFSWFRQPRINLNVKVPSGLALDVKDGSGELRVTGVTANTTIDDGSGSIEIRNHKGDIDLNDGSGSIDILGVKGNLEVRDGSGSMRIANVDGHVSIRDGSGSITVDTVKRGLTIHESGSGRLTTSNIEGGIDRH